MGTTLPFGLQMISGSTRVLSQLVHQRVSGEDSDQGEKDLLHPESLQKQWFLTLLLVKEREAARAAKQQKFTEQGRWRVVHQYHHPTNGDHLSSGPEDDFESCMRNIKSRYEVFQSSRLSSDATVLTPSTESSCDFMTKIRSTSRNDNNTSLELEWEDEEGMNRMLPVRERSKREKDILLAALTSSRRKTGSNHISASEDSNGLERENDFVRAEMDDNGNSKYSGFVNPVLELSDSGIKQSDADQQIR
ncbi:Gamma1-adaptin brefeldin A resistance protein [Heterocephalus glaber]|uniref:Gamma1-adaptin brefeldin A resistance protein n=1 Tax=Heterocephalus glaber TaxID=10181 RepID=G5BC82_HETGA|nr:Gamma1-adaptin brefeldin A resistance protein [Heterocephalus glaber]